MDMVQELKKREKAEVTEIDKKRKREKSEKSLEKDFLPTVMVNIRN